jgi:hypothetical protein
MPAMSRGCFGSQPSSVLDRIARALMLTDVEREHLFLLVQGRLPEVRHYRARGLHHPCNACSTRSTSVRPL